MLKISLSRMASGLRSVLSQFYGWCRLTLKKLASKTKKQGATSLAEQPRSALGEVWDVTMAVNLKGVFLGCKYGIPALRRAGGGSVINTASFVALLGAATPQLAYTASKGGVLALTRELAVVHARQNIRVNALCPGPLKTELLMSFLDTEEKRQRRLVHVPMGRFGLAGEIAAAAVYLASDESSYMTGATFTVDGGITSAYVTPE